MATTLRAACCALACALVPAAPAHAEDPIAAATAETPSPEDAGRRTLGRFGANLGRNLVGVFSRDNLKPLALGAGLAGFGRSADLVVRSRLRGPQKRFGSLGDGAGRGVIVAPMVAGLFVAGRLSHGGFRAASYDLAQATVINGLYTYALKQSIQRTRPDGSNNLSFPSGHTSNAFAWAAVASRHYGPRAGVPAYLTAGLIGLSRLQKDKHYASDVIAGATLGYIVGRTVGSGNGRPISARRFLLVPTLGPDGSGLGLSFSVDLQRR